jgi:hypothetical protein
MAFSKYKDKGLIFPFCLRQMFCQSLEPSIVKLIGFGGNNTPCILENLKAIFRSAGTFLPSIHIKREDS